MVSRVLVTGANGQLGSEMRALAGHSDHYIFTDVAELDITDAEAVRMFVREQEIGVVVNCAAYTNVDKAEEDAVTADLLNHQAVRNLALACKKANAFLIHISTDYVFQGDKNTPCVETESTSPLGVYGKTKLAGEESIQKVLGDTSQYLIFRTAWLYSSFGNNFVKTMRKLTAERENLQVVFDQVGTPTYAGDLAQAIHQIIENKLYETYNGIYHFSNEGVCSWYDFAKEIAELSGRTCHIAPCHSDEFPSKVRRPNFSVLDKTKFKRDFQLAVPYWKDSLKQCIQKLNS